MDTGLTYMRMLSEEDVDIFQLLQIYKMPKISQFLSISDNYFHYVTNTKNVYFYKIYESEKMIGTIHLEKHENLLHMGILVFPIFQRMGLGTKIIKDILNDIFQLDYERIEISIDEDNTASLRLFENAGFVATSKDHELVNFVYRRRSD